MISLETCPKEGDIVYYVDEVNLVINEFIIDTVTVRTSTELSINKDNNEVIYEESHIFAKSSKFKNFIWFDYDQETNTYKCQDTLSYLTYNEAKEYFEHLLKTKLKQKTMELEYLQKRIENIKNKLSNL